MLYKLLAQVDSWKHTSNPLAKPSKDLLAENSGDLLVVHELRLGSQMMGVVTVDATDVVR